MGYIFLRKKCNSKEGYVMKSIFGRYPQNIDKRIKTQWAMGYFFAIRKSIKNLCFFLLFDTKAKRHGVYYIKYN